MEQKHSSVCDGLPLRCAKYPWFVSDNLEAEEDSQTFYTIHDPLLSYHCRIPELLGKRIRRYFHGWVILSNSNNVMWSLWNQETSKIVRFPPLILKDGGDYHDIIHCCLSAPPDDSSSILLLTRTKKSSFVFCRLDRKRKRLKWTEMSYTNQIKRISGDGCLVHSLACCDGKVFALNDDGSIASFVIHVDIVVKDREVVIKLSVFGGCPRIPENFGDMNYYLKGTSTELFCIIVGFNVDVKKTLGTVTLFKLNMTSIKWEMLERLKDWNMTNIRGETVVEEDLMDLEITGEMWVEMSDLKNSIFFVDLRHDYSVFYRSGIASELGGYIHILGVMGKVIHSYHLKDKTISLTYVPSPVLRTSHVSLLEFRLEGDYDDFKQECKDDKLVIGSITDEEIVIRSVRNDEFEFDESHLLNLPFHVLEMIMKFCVGVEYMNFRATCKRCHLAASVIQWRDEATLKRLRNYSVASPWLMKVDGQQGIITFIDPMFGDKYFMKSLQVQFCHKMICYSRFGWLLLDTDSSFVLYNPFTSNMHKLPYVPYSAGSLCFSAPPTSPDSMVVGFFWGDIYIHRVAQEPSWRNIHLNCYAFSFPTFYGGDLYVLYNKEELHVFKHLNVEDYSWEKVADTPGSSPAQYFLTACDHHLLPVMVEFGESVKVFKLNDSTEEWEKIDDIGKHTIYICSTTCLCVEAKTPKMENNIYFKPEHFEDRRIIFYSLDTCSYDAVSLKNAELTYQFNFHVWVEPSWS